MFGFVGNLFSKSIFSAYQIFELGPQSKLWEPKVIIPESMKLDWPFKEELMDLWKNYLGKNGWRTCLQIGCSARASQNSHASNATESSESCVRMSMYWNLKSKFYLSLKIIFGNKIATFRLKSDWNWKLEEKECNISDKTFDHMTK